MEKVEEAIEKLSNPVHFDKDFGFANDEVLIELDMLEAGDIISLLQQGEADSKELKIVKEELKKVWQMWEKLYKELDYHSGDAHYKNAKILADRIKQEFFPKKE